MRKRNLDIARFRSRVCRKLAAIASTCATTAPWFEAFQRLSSEPTDIERLTICQAIRDDGCLSPEEGFYLVASQAEQFGCGRDDAELSELRRQLKAQGTTGKPAANAPWTSDADLVEFRKSREQIEGDCQESRLVETLLAAGEYEMTALYVKNTDEYQRLWNLGHELFHGERAASSEGAETWLNELSDRITALTTWDDPRDSFVVRACLEREFWVILAHPDPIEIVGGADDGAEILTEFRLDLFGLMGLFGETYQVLWDSATVELSHCPQVFIEGLYQGQHIFLSILAHSGRNKVLPFRGLR